MNIGLPVGNFFKNRKNSMHIATPKRYCFSLRFVDPERVAAAPWFLGMLASVGCMEVTAVMCEGRAVVLEFERVARSAERAILPVLEQVYRAVPELRFVEVAPDLVCLREAAVHAGCSRQNLRARALREPGFPLAAHGGNPELFHLADVLQWIRRTGRRAPAAAVLDLAVTARQINLARQLAQMPRGHVPARLRLSRFGMERYGL
jgi:hypothetical protein